MSIDHGCVIEVAGTVRPPAPTSGDARFRHLGLVGWRLGDVAGVAVWGRVTRAAAAAALEALAAHPRAPGSAPVLAITDLSRVTSVDADAFDHLQARLAPILDRARDTIAHHAIIAPPGVLGAATAGLAAATAGHAWELAPDLETALTRLARPALVSRVTALVEWCQADEQVLERVRACAGGACTVAAVARGLGMSSRALQRALAGLGTSFRAVRDQARLHQACTLLATTDDKVESIALQVGCATLSGFVRLFRRHHGQTPSQYRRRCPATSGRSAS